jgi:hypothetical protein
MLLWLAAAASAGLPPTRLELGGAIRPGFAPAALVRGGVEIAGSRRFALQADVGVTTPRLLYAQDGRRTLLGLDATASGLWRPNRLLALGPCLGGSYRNYAQQGRFIGASTTPLVGLRVDVDIVATRSLALGLSARVQADVDRTRFVLDGVETVEISPFDAQLAVHVGLGGRE